MGSLANRHGRVIAEVIAGYDTRFAGVVGAFVVKVFDTNAGAVGLSERSAVAAGINARAVWGAFSDRPDYYPEHASIVVKLVYEPTTMRLLGLQAVGAGDICRRIDVFSSFLQHHSTIADLLEHEHAYAPPYSEALDPLHHLAAMVLAQERGSTFVCAAQARDVVSEGATWLDVREPGEIEASPLPVNGGIPQLRIPLAELRTRLSEIDRSRTLNIVCRRGPRAYQASVLLQSHGYDKVHIVAGGTTAMGSEDDE
jgi:rhodanese-related sulfurtransferase